MAKTLAQRVHSTSNLDAAWRHVRESGRKSDSRATRQAVAELDETAARALRTIDWKLARKKYRFEQPVGIPADRPGKAPRPIVSAPISDRIVQRALLQIVQEVPAVRDYVRTPYSFGGVPEASIRDAVAAVLVKVRAGGEWYLKTDIKGFFTKIPRKKALARLHALLPDPSLNELLDAATAVELANADTLGRWASLFPTRETGVAQGSSLSSLLGNVLMHDFDKELNGSEVTSIRWVDDFIMIGNSEAAIVTAQRRARRHLKKYDMDVYLPGESSKASQGRTRSFSFLGCRISLSAVHPTPERKGDFLQRIDTVINRSIRKMQRQEYRSAQVAAGGYAQSVEEINKMARAWLGAYSFCSDHGYWDALDRKIQKKLERLTHQFLHHYGSANSLERQRLCGVSVVGDLPKSPLP